MGFVLPDGQPLSPPEPSSRGWDALTKEAGWATSWADPWSRAAPWAWNATGCPQGPLQGPGHALGPALHPLLLFRVAFLFTDSKGRQGMQQRMRKQQQSRVSVLGPCNLPGPWDIQQLSNHPYPAGACYLRGSWARHEVSIRGLPARANRAWRDPFCQTDLSTRVRGAAGTEELPDSYFMALGG